MQLNQSTDYAIRALMFLAGSNGRIVSVQEISEAIHVSCNYLRVIFQKLKKAGLINTISGKYGGVVLKRQPDEINLLDILRAVEGPSKICRCLDANPDTKNCPESCTLRRSYDLLQQLIDDFLRKRSISELLK